MNNEAVNKSIKEIAKKEGIEEKEVRKEMEKAIQAAYLNANPKWKMLFKENKIPTPEEFIIEIVKMIADSHAC